MMGLEAPVAWRVEYQARGERRSENIMMLEGVAASDSADAPPAPGQQYHWGSCAKALTATVIALLVLRARARGKGGRG
jgi:CubicO group peptidase (beta-lactamase class C family)